MGKLYDYSGPFRPNLKLSDFSSMTTVNILNLYSRLYMALDGFWYLTVKDSISNEVALTCDIQAWERLCRYEMARITKELNIQGRSVTDLMKAIQILPFFQQMQFVIDIISPNEAMLTFTDCPTLNALEKEGEGRENEICKIVDPAIFKAYASFFDPKIRVRCHHSPPRTQRNEECCKWEFSLL